LDQVPRDGRRVVRGEAEIRFIEVLDPERISPASTKRRVTGI